MTNLTNLLTLAEAATEYGYKAGTLRRAIWDKRLRGVRRGYVWFVSREDVEAYRVGNVRNVAARLGVKETMITMWCRNGRFPNARRVGRTWVIPETDVETMKGDD